MGFLFWKKKNKDAPEAAPVEVAPVEIAPVEVAPAKEIPAPVEAKPKQ
jgi:hypothetical protein